MSLYKDLSKEEKETVAYIDDEILRKAVIIDFEGPIVGDPVTCRVFEGHKIQNDFFE